MEHIDAFEIEGNVIVPCEDEETVRYEPSEKGQAPDVWSVFAHLPHPHGGGRFLIADCESADMAEFVQRAVAASLVKADAPVTWLTEKPKEKEGGG